MRKLIFSALCCLAFSPVMAFPIAEKGQAKCIIVHPDKTEDFRNEMKNFAPLELKSYLEKITGAEFRIYAESKAPANTPAIYIGNTAAAAKAGIKTGAMENREWYVKAEKNRMYIAGGTQTGTLYGLYIFLEEKLGVRYLSPEVERVPQKADVSLDDFVLSGKPAWGSNHNYHDYFQLRTGEPGKTMVELYEIKHRSGERWEDSKYDRKISMKALGGHSFFRYLPPDKYFKDHPEYYSMNEDGKRAYLPSGQLCLSNSAVKELVIRQLHAWIAEDKAANPGDYALVYDFSQEDNSNYICKCPECIAVTKKYGGEIGLVLEFVNDMAKSIEDKYPDIRIKTFAYVSTEKPVEGIRPAGNVIVQYCDLYSKSNRLKPLTDPENKERYQLLADWAAQTNHLSLWDYWNMGAGENPEILIDAMAQDIRLFKKLGVKYLFNECEIGTYSLGLLPQSFIWLQYYVSYKLMENPDSELEPIVEDFMNAYYGAAAPAMKEYLAGLRKAIGENTPTFSQIQNYQMTYVTPAFLVRSRNQLRKALAAADTDEIRQSVKNELNVIDYALIRESGKAAIPGIDRSAVIAEYRVNMLSYAAATRLINDDYREEAKKAIEDECETFNLKFADLPPGIAKDAEIRYFAHPHFPYDYQDAKRAHDPESTMKISLGYLPDDQSKHQLPWAMGVYEPTTKASIDKKLQSVPQDEKYHWVKVGNIKIGPQTRLWGHGSWHMAIYLRNAFVAADGIAETDNPNYYDVWVSIRFQGRAYVKNSTKPNAVYIDRVVLVPNKK